MLNTLLICIGLGFSVGLISGTFGVGGGIILVPAFLWTFVALDLPNETLWQTAIATSHACIVVISLGSALGHHKKGNVDFDIVKKMLPGLIIGGLILGPLVAVKAPVVALKMLFALFLITLGTLFILGRQREVTTIEPKWPGLWKAATSWRGFKRAASSWPGFRTAGFVVGTVSCIIGIGGGSLIIPFSKWRRVPIKKAVGTASASSVPIAVASVSGLIIGGWEHTDLASGYFGYVYLPAFVGVASASLISTRLGVSVAQRISSTLLTKLFGLLLLLISVSMIYQSVT